MTISMTNNTTYETCPICAEDYTDIERNDTQKVVQLACTHFFHMECLGSWFSNNEREGLDLSCGYCSQLSMPKYNPINSITLETFAKSLEKLEKNATLETDPKRIPCLTKLRTLSDSLINLLNNLSLIDESNVQKSVEMVKNWIKSNIDTELQRTAMQIILELSVGGGALKTLDDEVRHLSNLPYNKWPEEIENSGVPVYHKVDGKLIRMRVSKNYLERAVGHRVCDNIQNRELFENHIQHINSFYYYDNEAMDAIPHARNLQKALSKELKENSICSVEEIFLLIENKIEAMNIKEELKEGTRLIMNKFLFNLPALRTLEQEIDRWKKIPVRNWPSSVKEECVRVLDQYGSVKKYEPKDFIELVLGAGGTLNPPIEKMDIVRGMMVGIVICGIVRGLFKRS